MKILMVCLGNICRSPLAEGIMRHKITSQNLDIEVDSCGTSGWHDGERPHKDTLSSAALHGIDMTGIYSRKFIADDFDKFDLILCMDISNSNDVMAQARSVEDERKVKLILSYDRMNDLIDVPDPYFEGGFNQVYDLINNAIDALLIETESAH